MNIFLPMSGLQIIIKTNKNDYHGNGINIARSMGF